jgi:hypothetical protein
MTTLVDLFQQWQRSQPQSRQPGAVAPAPQGVPPLSQHQDADGTVHVGTPKYDVTVRGGSQTHDGGEVIVTDRATGQSFRAWGDPHGNLRNDKGEVIGSVDFHGSMTLNLDDGTKLTMNAEHLAGRADGTTNISSVAISNGNAGNGFTIGNLLEGSPQVAEGDADLIDWSNNDGVDARLNGNSLQIWNGSGWENATNDNVRKAEQAPQDWEDWNETCRQASRLLQALVPASTLNSLMSSGMLQSAMGTVQSPQWDGGRPFVYSPSSGWGYDGYVPPPAAQPRLLQPPPPPPAPQVQGSSIGLHDGHDYRGGTSGNYQYNAATGTFYDGNHKPLQMNGANIDFRTAASAGEQKAMDQLTSSYPGYRQLNNSPFVLGRGGNLYRIGADGSLTAVRNSNNDQVQIINWVNQPPQHAAPETRGSHIDLQAGQQYTCGIGGHYGYDAASGALIDANHNPLQLNGTTIDFRTAASAAEQQAVGRLGSGYRQLNNSPFVLDRGGNLHRVNADGSLTAVSNSNNDLVQITDWINQ